MVQVCRQIYNYDGRKWRALFLFPEHFQGFSDRWYLENEPGNGWDALCEICGSRVKKTKLANATLRRDGTNARCKIEKMFFSFKYKRDGHENIHILFLFAGFNRHCAQDAFIYFPLYLNISIVVFHL